jgi:hypothetical protein
MAVTLDVPDDLTTRITRVNWKTEDRRHAMPFKVKNITLRHDTARSQKAVS